MRVPRIFTAIVAGSIAVACSSEPVAPRSLQAPAIAASSQGMVKTPISGTFEPPRPGSAPDFFLATPSGRCHLSRGATNVFDTTGDLVGTLTAHYEPQNNPCNLVEPGSRLTAMGPMEGIVTFQGTTGPVEGHWNTECRPGDTVAGLTCDGVVNLRGHGELEGVQFHIDWGPGWWPLPYAGTAFSR